MDLRPWEGAVKEETFLHPGKHLHWRGDQLGQKGSFRGSEESATTGWWQAEQREMGTEDRCHLVAIPSPRCMPTGVCRGWVLKLRLQRTARGRGLGLAAWRQTEGAGVYGPQLGCTQKKPGPAIEAKCHC